MTIMDKNLEFSSAQAITVSAASTNVCYIGDKGIDKTDIRFVVNTLEASDVGTSIAVALQSCTTAGFGSATTLYSKTILVAALTANTKQIDVCVPVTGRTDEYLRVYYTVAGTAATTGTFDAYCCLDSQSTPL